jgi:LacI family transcriptional regulator
MPTAERATLIDVAREAGVSLATVDRVLHQRSGVHARTESRVAEAVRTLQPCGMAGQSWNAAAFLIAQQAVEGGRFWM